MSTTQDSHVIDINSLELKIHEKLLQLQFKEEALERTQLQLTASQKVVCELQIHLENECRTLNQARLELKSAMELIVRLEDEKIRGQTERARLQMTWENALLNQNHLVKQAQSAKLENVQLQRKNQILEASLAEQKMLNKVMEESLNGLRNQMSQFFPVLQSNVESLKREQESLRKSFQAVAEFKQLINNTRQNNHGKCRCDKKVFQELQQKEPLPMPVQPLYVPTSLKPTNINIPSNLKSAPKVDHKNLDEELNEISKELIYLESLKPLKKI